MATRGYVTITRIELEAHRWLPVTDLMKQMIWCDVGGFQLKANGCRSHLIEADG